uniref:RCC1-like domain-containing protein n=1 Tax=Branchiostoma floridae TaxID=7739 RepID=C3ZAS2_BRAFL|eukprot:XP_002594464.1 hypothetical protein BRAFLDRAFT_72132 [Branchiostoma floridae]
MALDPRGAWLVCAGVRGYLYIVPALLLLDPSAAVKVLWNKDDVTEVKPTIRHAPPTCIEWWYTFDDKQIAIIGTEIGELVFVDLILGREVSSTQVKEHVATMDLIRDDNHSTVHLLVGNHDNHSTVHLLVGNHDNHSTVHLLVGNHDNHSTVHLLVGNHDNHSTVHLLVGNHDNHSTVHLLVGNHDNHSTVHLLVGNHDNHSTVHLLVGNHDNHSTLHLLVGNHNNHSTVYLLVGNHDNHSTVHLLVGNHDNSKVQTQSGIQWRLLLEQRSSILPESPGTASGLGFEMVDAIDSFLHTDELRPEFTPEVLNQFTDDVRLSTQQAKGCSLLMAQDRGRAVCKVYDSGLQRSALYVYRLPHDSSHILLTDRLMFVTTADRDTQVKLNIVSNQMSETSAEEAQTEETNLHSVIQSFTLPPQEQVIALYRKTFPPDLLKKLESLHSQSQGRIHGNQSEEKGDLANQSQDMVHGNQSEDKGVLASQSAKASPSMNVDQSEADLTKIDFTQGTLLEGCVVVTSAGVYECRPRTVPEQLFLDLAVTAGDTVAAEKLGITLGLDMNMLYEVSADCMLSRGEVAQAVKLYQLSKAPHNKRIKKLAQYGHMTEVMTHLKQVLSKPGELPAKEEKQLCDCALHCYTQQILQHPDRPAIMEGFREFLMDNFHYDEQAALQLLASQGLQELLFEVAKARALVPTALELLAQQGTLHLRGPILSDLLSRGYSQAICTAAAGAFLKALSSGETVRVLLTQPDLALAHTDMLYSCVPQLEDSTLLSLARVFDPSRPQVNRALHMARARHRTTSSSSILSISSLDSDQSHPDPGSRAATARELVQFFFYVLIVINYRRDHHCEHGGPETAGEVPVKRKPPLSQAAVVSCGQQHVALLTEEGVYTWGKPHQGRLGHGQLLGDSGYVPPMRVETLSIQRVQVMAVACGQEHTLALCDNGVYAWGSSTYGQLGLGDWDRQTHPTLVTQLKDVFCVAVATGQYHSAALDGEGRVWMWGWGVHGQLGQGNAENLNKPHLVAAVQNAVQVSTGYAHTAVLTRSGEVFTFGCGLHGQLGHGATDKVSIPQRVQGIMGKVAQVACGLFHTVVVTSSQQVYTFGRHPQVWKQYLQNSRRQARASTSYTQSPAKHAMGLSGELFKPLWVQCRVEGRIRQVVAGAVHNMLLTSSVVAIAAGEDFSVAVDRSGKVWVWGRNSHGQLGIDMKQSSSSSSSSSSLGISSFIGRDVLTPLQLQGIPGAIVLREEEDHDVSGEDEESLEDPEDDAGLPDLSTVDKGGPSYGRQALRAAIKHLGTFYQPHDVVRLCQDYEDWASAADIYDELNLFPQALVYRLKALRRADSEMSSDEAVNHVSSYITMVIEDSTGGLDSSQRYQQLLEGVVEFWQEGGLDTAGLEPVLETHLPTLACPLFMVLHRGNRETQTAGEAPSTLSVRNCSEPQTAGETQSTQSIRFSTSFHLKLTSAVTQQITQGKVPLEQEEALQEAILGSNHSSLLPLPSNSDNLVPEDKLWQEIMHNLQKDAGKRGCIQLSQSEAEAVFGDRRPKEESRIPQKAVFFTCGHSYREEDYREEVYRFESRMKAHSAPLPLTTRLLCDHFNTNTQIPMACPNRAVENVTNRVVYCHCGIRCQDLSFKKRNEMCRAATATTPHPRLSRTVENATDRVAYMPMPIPSTASAPETCLSQNENRKCAGAPTGRPSRARLSRQQLSRGSRDDSE